MLNFYFVFGVPIFLFALYLGFAYLRKKTKIHYLGFILLIISGFMFVFNLQTWQQAATEMQNISSQTLSAQIGYPVYLIWVPIIVAGCLFLLNLFRGYRRLTSFKRKNT
ncbi:hypothetical protein [Candidatus Enterococcus courvalinii]|uniref:Uncharacterized protein n=1 Tax=Candidatus Enterococcus courvalinii TaxID=2815329 RepID=A0ABS3I2P3_9ENTE|nr:hypothetical protein [Enterococcus sp. MSG2901]